MNVTFYSARLDEYARREARSSKPQTAPWWVEPLIAGCVAVMAWLLFVGC